MSSTISHPSPLSSSPANQLHSSSDNNATTPSSSKPFIDSTHLSNSLPSTVPSTPPKTSLSLSLDTSSNNNKKTNTEDMVATEEESSCEYDPNSNFSGDVKVNNELPTHAMLKKIEELPVLDKDGRSIPFGNLYMGPNVPRRVLVVFIRHFFCGNCQEYIRTLSRTLTPDSLLTLPTPTFLAIIGCGSPSLITMYASTTSCPFPIYADPTKELYSTLGMVRTLDMGVRPEYQRQNTMTNIFSSVWQGLRHLKSGLLMKGGDMYQVGGEFLFEPLEGAKADVWSPGSVLTPGEENMQQLGVSEGKGEKGKRVRGEEEKRITWCHRMRNTRDHVEIPELREVLGFEDVGMGGGYAKRWEKALLERKGTGLSGTVKGSQDRERDEKKIESAVAADTKKENQA